MIVSLAPKVGKKLIKRILKEIHSSLSFFVGPTDDIAVFATVLGYSPSKMIYKTLKIMKISSTRK
jgi:hypothetical protein